MFRGHRRGDVPPHLGTATKGEVSGLISPGSQIRRRRVAVSLAALVLVLALAVAGAVHATSLHAAPAATPACSANTTVQTDKGSVCGVTTDGVTTYFSVPYAAAPVGALRWRPPQPHAPWSGVLASTQEAVECTNVFAQFTQANSSEDCLNLKIMVPAGTPAGAKLPVMFEFHGGGFLGEARTDDGSNLVHTGNVVYVYVNYRLGILGFLADKALGPHSGDYGLQDQQAGPALGQAEHLPVRR